MKIAVVGSGIAGLTAAYVLARAHAVTLLERDVRIGGHVHTVDVDGLGVDTGFIVHNRKNYPLLTRLFDELEVETRETVMSFSVTCDCGVAWSSRRPWRAGPGLLREILRFLRTAGDLDPGERSWDELLRDEGYSDSFRRHYLAPMTSALWSTGPGDALATPAAFGLDFFRNHSLLGLRRHRWRTVVGGSRRTVDALLERTPLEVRSGRAVQAIRRTGEGAVELRLDGGAVERFDACVVATHAPTALALLEWPTEEERRLLGAFDVTRNEVVLHSDRRLLPRRPGDRSAWNVRARACGAASALPTVTYSMNRLQGLDAHEEWCVTLNSTAEVAPARIVRVLDYAHPRMTFAALAAQPRLDRLNDGTLAFAGAWQGNGFHEDGVRSGVAAAASLGVRW
jgi:predicted NAD/FAD-binding protein